MPKSKAELLKIELERMGLELLDVYGYRDTDFIRVRHRHTGAVFVYGSKKKVKMLTSQEDAKSLALDIAKKAGIVK